MRICFSIVFSGRPYIEWLTKHSSCELFEDCWLCTVVRRDPISYTRVSGVTVRKSASLLALICGAGETKTCKKKLVHGKAVEYARQCMRERYHMCVDCEMRLNHVGVSLLRVGGRIRSYRRCLVPASCGIEHSQVMEA